MAPKKATKGKGVAAEPTRDEGWNTSKCSQSDLDSLVSHGLLVPRSIIQWRPALGKDHPYGNTGEIIAFYLILGTSIGVSLLFFLFWTSALLQDQIASSDPKFLCSYFHLRAFMRSFSGHRAPFRTLLLSFSFETAAQQIRLRRGRGRRSLT